jgi:Type IV secretory pathway, VirB11 components, and related ATPases involved in archaeal flagella biosynthesis
MDEEKDKGLNSLLKRLGKVDFEPIKKEETTGKPAAEAKTTPPPPPVAKIVEDTPKEESVKAVSPPPAVKPSPSMADDATISDILKRLKTDIPETPSPKEPVRTTPSPPPARSEKAPDLGSEPVLMEEKPAATPAREMPRDVSSLEEPKAAPLPRERAKPAPVPPVAASPIPEPVPVEKSSVDVRSAKKTRWSEGTPEGEESKVVTVDEIKDISDLILPKGATFEIDEVHLQGRTTPFGTGETLGTIPREIDDLWKASLPATSLGEIGAEGKEDKKKSLFDGFKKLSISKVIRPEAEEYNPKIHGPLVDLSMRPQSGIEEVELYPLNEPYAYVRILLDNNTHEYTYQVLEPALSVAEKDLFQEIKERLFETLDVNTKDLTKEKARKVLRNSTDDIIFDFGIKLTPISREKILYNIEKEFIGDGLIDPIMHDKYIEDISCDGVRTTIFVYHTSYENIKPT